MNPLTALAVFILSLSDDLLAVLYLRRVSKDKRMQAALLSGVLTALISLEVTLYITDPIYVAFNVAGSLIGTPLAMWADDKWPAKRQRDKRGKFVQLPPLEVIKLKKEGE